MKQSIRFCIDNLGPGFFCYIQRFVALMGVDHRGTRRTSPRRIPARSTPMVALNVGSYCRPIVNVGFTHCNEI